VVAASMSGCSSSDSNGASGGSAGKPSGGSAGTSSAGSAGSSAAGTKNGAAGEGEAGTGGTGGTGGSLGSAGADTTGTAGADTTGMAGDTGAAGAGAQGSAVAKFCNEVQSVTDGDITLRLEVGTAPDVVTFDSLSGTCVPMTGACRSVPLGAVVPVKLFDHDAGDILLGSATIEISDGLEYIFYADVPSGTPTIEAAELTPGALTCSTFAYADLPQ